jgi:hypothetical protein
MHPSIIHSIPLPTEPTAVSAAMIRRLLLLSLILTVGFLCPVGPAGAQPKPLTPNPQAPTLKPPFPLGAQRGTTLDLTLTGTNLNEPVGVSLSFPAKVTIPTEGNNGKDGTRLLVRLEIPPDAPIGMHSLRLATTRGMSNLRLFCVDDLPQVLENNAARRRPLKRCRSLAWSSARPAPRRVTSSR